MAAAVRTPQIRVEGEGWVEDSCRRGCLTAETPQKGKCKEAIRRAKGEILFWRVRGTHIAQGQPRTSPPAPRIFLPRLLGAAVPNPVCPRSPAILRAGGRPHHTPCLSLPSGRRHHLPRSPQATIFLQAAGSSKQPVCCANLPSSGEYGEWDAR